MLIEFSVENFRSVRERQTLSMVAAPRLKTRSNTFDPQIAGEKFPALLKIAAIYGPNASGKSTLVKALSVLRELVKTAPTTDARTLPVVPFRFDPELLDKPSKFEVHFVANNVRFAFNVDLTQERIHAERLVSYVKGKERLLYERVRKEGRDVYEFGQDLEGGKELHDVWRKLTGPQALFLAQAVANSNEELRQLRIPFDWLEDLTPFGSSSMSGMETVSQRLVADAPKFGKQIAEFLSDVDIPITAIQSRMLDADAKPVDVPPGFAHRLPADERERMMRLNVFSSSDCKTTLTHKTSLGEVDFDLSDESDGTKNLFGFSIPWFLLSTNGMRVLVIDEFDSSLHPKLVEAIVRRHLASGANSQLVFTTHDTHLMDSKLLRRDQFWLTERDGSGATQLRCLHDFEGREGEDIEKRYYEGRYRALPLIGSV